MIEKTENNFINKVKGLWAKNGDMISTIYTGTGATTSIATGKGEKAHLK